MKIAFAGTPDFAQAALAALLQAGFDVSLVLTQPDRPAGRGMRLHASPVKALAQAHAIPVIQPRSLRLDGKYPEDAAAAQDVLRATSPDVMVVAAYGLLLPRWVLALPRLGCLNIHASLLPRWRGAAPIQRAIEAGDTETGITIMQMDAGLDTGAMLCSERVTITPETTTSTLHDALAPVGATLIVDALRKLEHGGLSAQPQPSDGATYASKITRAEAALDWTQPAQVLQRRIRAFDPFPGSTTDLNGQTIKIWGARLAAPVSDAPAEPGTILQADNHGVQVACGTGTLQLLELQRAGGKRLPARDFLSGFPLQAGQRFDAALSRT